MARCVTTSQTVGPFFQIGFELLMNADIAGHGLPGGCITIEGQVLDGERVAIPDAVIEIWHADSRGRYADLSFHGFGRTATDDLGRFRFTTIKPGATPGPGGEKQAPHLGVAVLMRGLLKHLFTRVYFPDEPGNSTDPILNMVPPARRNTLIAQKTGDGALRWDILMQGPDETVFFDV